MGRRQRKVEVIRVVPNADHLKETIYSLVPKGAAIVTAFSSERISVLHSLVEPLQQEGFEVDVIDWRSAVSGELMRHHIEARPPSSGLVETSIGKALLQLSDERPLASVARFKGARTAIAQTLDTLRAWNIDSEKLRSLAGQAKGDFAEKLKDLGTVAFESELILARLQRVHLSRHMQECMESTEEPKQPLRQWIVYVGSEVHPFNRKWLEWLHSIGGTVTVIVDSHVDPKAEIFQGSKWWISEDSLFGEFELLKGSELCANLFSEVSEQVSHNSKPEVSFRESPSVLSECEWTVREIAEIIASGVKPSSVAVYIRSLELYAPLLSAAATKFGINLHFPQRVALLSNGFARHFLELLNALGNPKPKEFLQKLGTGYLASVGITVDLSTVDGWDSFNSLEHEDSALKELLDWRQTVIDAHGSLTEWHDRLMVLAEQGWSVESISSDSFFSVRDRHAHSGLRRALSVAASFEKFDQVEPLSYHQFVHKAKTLWDEEQITLPTNVEGVQVCGKASGLGQCEVVYVLGTLEGVFPKRRREDPILNDEELEILGNLNGGCTFKNSHDNAAEERDEFYRLVASANSKLVLSYPLTSDDRDSIPAHYLHLTRQVSGATDVTRYKRKQWTPDDPTLEVDLRLKRALDDVKLSSLPVILQNPESNELVAKGSNELSISALQDAQNCMFKYLAEHRLKISVERTDIPYVRLLSLPRSSNLSVQLDPVSAREALEQDLDTILEEMELSVADRRLLHSAAKRWIEGWIEREFKARELWKRSEIDVEETQFGGEHLRGTLKNFGLSLRGSATAVSKQGPYTVFHLYRIGDPMEENSDHADLDRIKESERLRVAAFVAAAQGEPSAPIAIEWDSFSGRRLILVPRVDDNIRSDVQSQLKAVGLDVTKSKVQTAFGDMLTPLLMKIRRGEIRPNPSDRLCKFCDFGELCRRSHFFGEVEPFEGGEI